MTRHPIENNNKDSKDKSKITKTKINPDVVLLREAHKYRSGADAYK